MQRVSIEPSLRFGLGDLGLLDGPAHPEIDIILNACATLLEVPRAAFFVMDTTSGTIFARGMSGFGDGRSLPRRMPMADTLVESVVVAGRAMTAVGAGADAGIKPAKDVVAIDASGGLGVPVHGPAGEAVGALVAYRLKPGGWTDHDRDLIRGQALLLTRHILLKAALETLKRISQEGERQGRLDHMQN